MKIRSFGFPIGTEIYVKIKYPDGKVEERKILIENYGGEQ